VFNYGICCDWQDFKSGNNFKKYMQESGSGWQDYINVESLHLKLAEIRRAEMVVLQAYYFFWA